MTIKQSLLLLTLVCSCLSAHSQQGAGPSTPRNKWGENMPGAKLAVNFTPTTLLNPAYPAAHLGMEIRLNERYTLVPEAGYLLRHGIYRGDTNSILSLGDFDSENKGGFLQLGIRRSGLLGSIPRLWGGLQLTWLYNHYRRTDTFDDAPLSTPSNVFCFQCVTETYEVKKHFLALRAQLGYTLPIAHRASVSVYAGMGPGLLSNTHLKNAYRHRSPAVADAFFSYYSIHYPGTYLAPMLSFTVGAKITYTLK